MLTAFVLLLLGTIAGTSIIVGIVILREMRVERSSQRARGATLDTLSLGLVEISGRVIANEDALSSPLSQQQCVHYNLLVEGRHALDADWEREAEFSESVPFSVSDGTGVVGVSHRAGLWKLDRRALRVGPELPDRVREALQSRYGSGALTVACAEYRITESILVAGDTVNVLLSVYGIDPPQFDVVRVSPETAIDSSPKMWPSLALVSLIAVGAITLIAVIA